MTRPAAALMVLTCLAPLSVGAHGVLGHVHVTGWAVENLPAGALRDFFDDPAVLNAALFGAAYTDSGYSQTDASIAGASAAYSEHTHWEPFIQDFIEWIAANDPPPWTSVESRQRVAFLMGCASHGLQDEIFDSLFLFQVMEHDNGNQSNADPASDGFLGVDGHLRFFPEIWLPMDTLLELYGPMGAGIDAGVINDSVGLMMTFYVNDTLGPVVAQTLAEEHEADLTWMRAHYLDPAIPGSLRAEIVPTLHYLEAIWDRLHGRFTPGQAVIATYPGPPRRLLGVDSDSPDSWVTFIYGVGVSESEATFKFTNDDAAAPVPFATKGTRWGADFTRLHRLQPSADLAHDAWHTATLAAGVPLIDGGQGAETSTVFQTPCAGGADCPDPVGIVVPAIDGSFVPEPDPEPEPAPDVGPSEIDAGVVEADAPPEASDSGCQGSPGSAPTPGAWWFPLGLIPCLLVRRAAVLR